MRVFLISLMSIVLSIGCGSKEAEKTNNESGNNESGNNDSGVDADADVDYQTDHDFSVTADEPFEHQETLSNKGEMIQYSGCSDCPEGTYQDQAGTRM